MCMKNSYLKQYKNFVKIITSYFKLYIYVQTNRISYLKTYNHNHLTEILETIQL